MKFANQVTFGGRLYSYALESTEDTKGECIRGDVSIEVDADGRVATTKVYLRPRYNSGKVNKSYLIAEEILAGNYKTVVDDGDEADFIEVTGSPDISYFMKDGEMARSQKKTRVQFINPNPNKIYTNKWRMDALITKIEEVEANEERGTARYARLNCYVPDDYSARVTEFAPVATSEGAVNYLLGLNVSIDQPYFVNIRGELGKVSRSILRKNAFGDPEVEVYDSIHWVVTAMSPDPYDFGDENVMTADVYSAYRDGLTAFLDEIKAKATGDDDDVAF